MNRLLNMTKVLGDKYSGEWTLDGTRVNVQFGRTNRHQVVTLAREKDFYVFTSVILGTTSVTKNNNRWSEIALMAWQWNAEHELITCAFDVRNRLVGQIRHPAEHLDANELEVYITTLARECDRREFILRGWDRQ